MLYFRWRVYSRLRETAISSSISTRKGNGDAVKALWRLSWYQIMVLRLPAAARIPR
jgi:hypothetical protein